MSGSSSGSTALQPEGHTFESGPSSESLESLSEPQETPFFYAASRLVLPPLSKNISLIISDNEFSNRSYQELLHAYFHISAGRLDAYSPCSFELWRTYVPAMALGVDGSQALLNAIGALAALQITPLQRNQERGRERAQRYYLAALKDHHVFDTPGKYRLSDAMIATSMLLAHYEVLQFDKYILRN